jgi:hypothetical protein
MHSSPFAAPVVSSSESANAPESGGAQLTISGLQFGISEPSASLLLASASCSTTSWTSATSAACTSTSSAAGQVLGLRIVIAAVFGTGSSIVFDASPTPSPTPSPSPRRVDVRHASRSGTVRHVKAFVVCSQPDACADVHAHSSADLDAHASADPNSNNRYDQLRGRAVGPLGVVLCELRRRLFFPQPFCEHASSWRRPAMPRYGDVHFVQRCRLSCQLCHLSGVLLAKIPALCIPR